MKILKGSSYKIKPTLALLVECSAGLTTAVSYSTTMFVCLFVCLFIVFVYLSVVFASCDFLLNVIVCLLHVLCALYALP